MAAVARAARAARAAGAAKAAGRRGGLILLVLAVGCARPGTFDWSTLPNMVDLSHAYSTSTLYWPTSPTGFKLDQLAYGQTPGGWFYSSYAFSSPEHGGTHLDAPIHFSATGRTADQIPLQQLIAPAVVIDITARAEADRDATLSVEEITAHERAYGAIPAGALVLLRTGWDRHWGNRLAYFGDSTPGDASRLHFPGYGIESAKLLIEERKVAGLGVDSPSIDHGPSKEFLVHRALAARDGIGLENLKGLDQLPPVGALLIALPMKIENGSGGPVRVVGLLPSAR